MADLNELRDQCHKIAQSKGFWKERANVPDVFVYLIYHVTALSEAKRQNLVPEIRQRFGEVLFRLLDLGGKMDVDVEKAIANTVESKQRRPVLPSE